MAEERKKRRRWGLLAAAAFVLVLFAAPFIFTRSLVLWLAGRAGYAAFTPTVGQARLAVGGGLELKDVVLHEAGSAQTLLQAQRVRVAFSWGGLWNRRVETVNVEGLQLQLRDGKDGPTLLQLGAADAPAAPPAGTKPAGGSSAWQLGSITCRGGVHLSPIAGVRTPREDYPFELTYGPASSARPTPLRIALGDPTEHLHIEGTLEERQFRGSIAWLGPQLVREGERRDELEAVQLQGNVELRLGPDALRSLAVRQGNLSIRRIAAGNTAATHLSADIEGADGILSFTRLQATFADGDFSGSLQLDLPERRLRTARLNVHHLDQRQVALNLAPDRLEAEGAVSGTIELDSADRGALGGAILLTGDGPGRLRIKDEQVAGALAQKLESGAAPGVLPANFNTIVIDQLKNYPYTRGRVEVRVVDGTPVVTLHYVREPVKEGEAGYGIDTELAGQKVKANYTVQLPGLSLVLKGKTIEQLLAMAAGLAGK